MLDSEGTSNHRACVLVGDSLLRARKVIKPRYRANISRPVSICVSIKHQYVFEDFNEKE